jgi:hypothetical protein
VIESDEPIAAEQTSTEANISHHSAPTRPARELHPTSTSSAQSTRLFTPTTHNTPFARLRFRRGPHFFPQHSTSAQLYLPTAGLLLLPLAMANVRQSYIKKISKRGDFFFDYGSTPDQLTAELCFPSDDSDNNEPGGIGDGQDEGLSRQFAGLSFRDADAGTRGHRPRRHSEENNSTVRTVPNLQWQIDNLPIDSTRPPKQRISITFRRSSDFQWETDNLPSEATHWPSDEEPAGESTPHEGGLSDEHIALIALGRAYNGLQLPMPDDVGGESKNYMVQLAVQFIFLTLPCLNYIRGDLETLPRDLYDVHALAEQFYVEYRVAIWGPGGGDGGDLDNQRLTHLEAFFNALRTQETVRDEAETLGDEPLEQLVHLQRAAAATSRVVPSGTHSVVSLSELYAALEIQTADNWVNNAFPRAVAEITLEALCRVRDPVVTSFPCSLPSGILIEGVIDRIMGRYGNKLWPNDTARPENVMMILHQYILALMKSNMASKDIGKGVEMLDTFLGVENGETKQTGSHVDDEPSDHDSFACTVEDCSETFSSKADLSTHLDQVHNWGQEVADDFVYNCLEPITIP